MVGDRVQQKWLCQFWVWPLTALLPDAMWWEEARPQKRGHTQVLWLQLSSQPKPAFKPAVWVAIMDIQSVCTPADMTTERSQGKKITQLRSVIPQNYEILIVRLLFQLWNKIFILWEDKKIKRKIFSALWPSLSLHSALCSLSQQQKYLLNHKKQHPPSINKAIP